MIDTPSEIIAELTRAKCVFQLRTITTAMGLTRDCDTDHDDTFPCDRVTCPVRRRALAR